MNRWSRLFELSDGSHQRWQAMEGLRGLAVILVFFVHYSELVLPYLGAPLTNLPLVNGINELGNAGVDLFFVLSGFLIYRTCITRTLAWKQYAARRVERIYPTFIAALAIYITLMILVPEFSKLPASVGDTILAIVANLLLLPGVFPLEPLITVAWSLSYEALFYLLVPLCIVGFRMKNWRPWQRGALFFAIGTCMTLGAAQGHTHYYRASMFLGGMILQEFAGHRPTADGSALESRLVDILLLMAFVLALVAFTLLGRLRWAVDGSILALLPKYAKFPLLNVCFVLLLLRCLFVEGLAKAIFSWAPLRWLGNMSFSYYLFHGLALQAFFKIGAPLLDELSRHPGLFIALLGPAFAASIALSLPLYLCVERPFSLLPAARGQGVMDRLRLSFATADVPRI